MAASAEPRARDLLLRFALERRISRHLPAQGPVLTLQADPSDLALLKGLGLVASEEPAGCRLALGRPGRWCDDLGPRRASALEPGARLFLVLEPGCSPRRVRSSLGRGFRWQRPVGRGLLLPGRQIAPGTLGFLAALDALLCGLLPALGRQVVLEGERC